MVGDWGYRLAGWGLMLLSALLVIWLLSNAWNLVVHPFLFPGG
jgi:hypothetical protein